MREIKFRGKSLKTGEWVYGGYVRDALCDENMVAEAGIVPDGCYPIAVSPETVGQFTGLHDKNGKDIYDGDVVSVPYVNPIGCVELDTVDYISVITYQNGGFVIDSCELKVEKIGIVHSLEKSPGRYVSNYGNVTEYGKCLLKIIGNIHENPGLLESGDE